MKLLTSKRSIKMKLRFQFKSIKTKLIFWFLVIALLPLIIITGIGSFQTAQTLKENQFEKLTAVRNRKTARINDWLDERIGDIYTLADDWETEAAVDTSGKEQQEPESDDIHTARELFKHFVERHDMFGEIFLINPETGKITISTNKYREGDDKSNDKYFTGVLENKGHYVKDIYYSKTANRLVMAVSAPVYNRRNNSDKIAGIVVARIDLSRSLLRVTS